MGIIYLAVSRLLNGAIGLVVVFLMSNYFSAEEYGLFGLLFATMTAISALCFSWMGAYFLRFKCGYAWPVHFSSHFIKPGRVISMFNVCLFGSCIMGYSRNLVDRVWFCRCGLFLCRKSICRPSGLYRSYFSVSFVRFCLALGFVGITMVFMPDLKIIIFVLSVAMLLPSLIVLFYQPYFSTAASNFRDFISLSLTLTPFPDMVSPLLPSP